jgi:hypothetical protein
MSRLEVDGKPVTMSAKYVAKLAERAHRPTIEVVQRPRPLSRWQRFLRWLGVR